MNKNMKRVLSLGLSSIMLTGMMALGAGAADFTDQDTIEHKEAVDVLVALNIINGMEDGSYFAPKDNVTRAQMAKMIAVAMKGGNDVSTGVKGTPSFSDIQGHWAESYIEYCYDLGIIAGRGDGTFDPEANVTGTEVTKMVLSALGYDADAYKLVGPSWAARADELARKASPSLYEDLSGSVVLSQPSSRENAAQIIWNGLQNNTKTYVPTTNTSNGEVEWSYVDAAQMLKVRYDAEIFVGKMTGNYDMDNTMNKGEIKVVGGRENKDEKNISAMFPSDLAISNIGEEVKVVYKDGNKGINGKPDNKDTIYGVFNTGATTVYWTTKADVKNGSDSPKEADRVAIGSSEYTISPDFNEEFVTVDYGAGASTDVETMAEAKAAIEALNAKQSTDKIKLVCDDNGKVDHVYVERQYIGYVTAVNGDKLTINGVGTFSMGDNDVYEDPAKFDVVTYTRFYDTNKDNAFFTVKKAEMVEGQLTGYTAGDTDEGDRTAWKNVTIDGTRYKVENRSLRNVTIDNTSSETMVDDNDIGETFTAYLLNGMVGILMQDTNSAAKLAVVIESDLKNEKALDNQLSTSKARLLLADGSKITVTLHEDSVLYREVEGDDGWVKVSDDALLHNGGVGDEVDGKKCLTKTDLEPGDIVRYTSMSNGQYKLIEVYPTETESYKLVTSVVAAEKTKVYDKDTKSVVVNPNDANSETDVTSGDCVLFTGKGSNGWKVYNIRSLNDIKTDAENVEFNYVLKDGKVVAAYVERDTRPSGSASSTVYGIVTGFNGTTVVSGDTYDKYTVENGEGSYTLLMKYKSAKLNRDDGMLVSFEPTNDDIYDDDDVTILDGTGNKAGIAAWVKEYDSGAQTLTYYTEMFYNNGNKTFEGSKANTKAVDDDVIIDFIDSDNSEPGADIGVSEFDSSTGYTNALLICDEDNGKIVAILVESSGEANIVDNKAVVLTSDSTLTAKKGDTVTANAIAYDDALRDSTQKVTVSLFSDATAETAVELPEGAMTASATVDEAGVTVITVKVAETVDATATYYATVKVGKNDLLNNNGEKAILTVNLNPAE